jgi:hypothetical protein
MRVFPVLARSGRWGESKSFGRQLVPPSSCMGACSTELWCDVVVWGNRHAQWSPSRSLFRVRGSTSFAVFPLFCNICSLCSTSTPLREGFSSSPSCGCNLCVGLFLGWSCRAMWVLSTEISVPPCGAAAESSLLLTVMSKVCATCGCLISLCAFFCIAGQGVVLRSPIERRYPLRYGFGGLVWHFAASHVVFPDPLVSWLPGPPSVFSYIFRVVVLPMGQLCQQDGGVGFLGMDIVQLGGRVYMQT